MLLPILDPVWLPLSPGVEVTAWPLRLTDGSFLLGVSAAEAEVYASAIGGELTTALEEDQIIQAAALVLRPITHQVGHWPAPSVQSGLMLRQLEEHGGCDEAQFLAGVCKTWTRDKRLESGPVRPGHACNYGFPVPAGECGWRDITGQSTHVWIEEVTPVYPAASRIPFWMLQGLADFHGRDHSGDYSQGVRVRRSSSS